MVQLKNICLRAFFSLLFPFLTSKQVCLLQLYLQHEDEPFNSLRCSLAISTSSFTPNNILSLWNFLSFPLSLALSFYLSGFNATKLFLDVVAVERSLKCLCSLIASCKLSHDPKIRQSKLFTFSYTDSCSALKT